MFKQLRKCGLKPENILLATKTSSSPIKLADFGLAIYVITLAEVERCLKDLETLSSKGRLTPLGKTLVHYPDMQL